VQYFSTAHWTVEGKQLAQEILCCFFEKKRKKKKKMLVVVAIAWQTLVVNVPKKLLETYLWGPHWVLH
jgi:hypothetical protein